MDMEGGVFEKSSYYFVTLRTVERQAVFAQYLDFQQEVEGAWASALKAAAGINSREFNLNSISLYALLEVEADLGLGMVEETIQAFLAETEASWQAHLAAGAKPIAPSSEYTLLEFAEGDPLWDPQFELRLIQEGQELSSLRDFIVQKMLGGEELSNLNFDTMEWDEEDDGDASDSYLPDL